MGANSVFNIEGGTWTEDFLENCREENVSTEERWKARRVVKTV
jgi:hypothetical protein